MTVNINQTPVGPMTSPVPSTPVPNGPGGNQIVPTPATPNEWWKMLFAIGIGASGIWIISTMFSEDAAKWTAALVLLGIITYYETHDNHEFSSGIQGLASLAGIQ